MNQDEKILRMWNIIEIHECMPCQIVFIDVEYIYTYSIYDGNNIFSDHIMHLKSKMNMNY